MSFLDQLKQHLIGAEHAVGIGNAPGQHGTVYQSVKKNLVQPTERYFAPTPNVRARDLIRELPGAAVQTGEQYVTQPAARLGAQITNTVFHKPGFTPTTTAARHLFGDAPVGSLQDRYQGNKQFAQTKLHLNPLTAAGVGLAGTLGGVAGDLPVVPELKGTQTLAKEAGLANSLAQTGREVKQALRGGKVKERGFITSVKEGAKTPQPVKDLVQGTYVVKSDKQLVNDTRRLIQADPAAAEKLAINPQTDVHITIGNQLIDHYLSTGNFDKVTQLAENMAQSGTELGRAVHAFAQYDKTTPAGALKFAQKTIADYNKTARKPLQLGHGDIQALMDQAHTIQQMSVGRERNIASQQLMDQVNNLIPSSVADKAITVWKAGLLTALRTTERNLLGNAVHGVAETVKDAPAALADMLLSAKTGKRTLAATVKGVGSGIKKGLGAAKDIYALGYDPEQAINKFDVNHITWKKNPVEQALKKYTDTVFRHMSAQDKPFYHAAFARSLYDQAGSAAINASKRGDSAFIENLVHNATETMKTIATKDAQTAVFQNKNVASKVANDIKNNLGAFRPIGEVIAPFTGVPSSIAGQLLAYSPIGLAKGLVSAGHTATDLPTLQRQAAQEIGRGIVGTGIMGIAAYLAGKGLITGSPKDAQESRQWQLEGKQANSIMINGKWRSINSVGPEALVALAGAKIQAGGGAGTVAGNLGKDFLSQTFLSGVQQPLQAITDPARYGGSYLKSQVASLTPNIVKDTAKSLDPLQRQTNNVKEAAQATIPGARNNLLPVRDALGNPVPEQTGANAFLDLFNSKTPVKTPVVDELGRLGQTGNSATPTKINPKQTIGGQKVTLTPRQIDALDQKVGPQIQHAFTNIISDPKYQGLSDADKATVLGKAVTDLRALGKVTVPLGVDPLNQALGFSNLTKDQQYLATQPDQFQIDLPSQPKVNSLTPDQVSSITDALAQGDTGALTQFVLGYNGKSSSAVINLPAKLKPKNSIKGVSTHKPRKGRKPRLYKAKTVKLPKAKTVSLKGATRGTTPKRKLTLRKPRSTRITAGLRNRRAV